MSSKRFWRRRASEGMWLGLVVIAGAGVVVALEPLPTTPRDFEGPGTQPDMMVEPLMSVGLCAFCHGNYSEYEEPYTRWSGSLKAQAANDPVFLAALNVANHDTASSGQTCLRCHSPIGFLRGHTQDPTGAQLDYLDFQGVSCQVCHRMVNPNYEPGVSPAVDEAILAGITQLPTNPHNGSYIIDPMDRRRGPFNMDVDWNGNFPFHVALQSEYHESSEMCATCHDVSHQHFSKAPSGAYALNAFDTPAPTDDKLTQYPEQRTYSEWSQSLFAQGPVELNFRYGGNESAVGSCQECHMPVVTGHGCSYDPPLRDDLPQHNFAGGDTWVIRAVNNMFETSRTNLTEEAVAGSIMRNTEMLQRAADLNVTSQGRRLGVRIVNFSGHKLPTGHAEGVRMWINVKYFDAQGNLVAERGAYDPENATLTEADTKVYEAVAGIDDDQVMQLTGAPAGEGFHQTLNNRWFKDNRIPPMGFTNEGFESVQCAPIGYAYADGQYWDDTTFAIPSAARTARVTVNYQKSTRSYMEFLRDQATDGSGQAMYDQWVALGKSAPVAMNTADVMLPCPADWNHSGGVSSQDFFDFITDFFTGTGDFNGDATVNSQDFFDFIVAFYAGC